VADTLESPSSIHPELSSLRDIVFLTDPAGRPSFGRVKEFLISCKRPGDPLQITTVEKGDGGTRDTTPFQLTAQVNHATPHSAKAVSSQIVARLLTESIIAPENVTVWTNTQNALTKFLEGTADKITSQHILQVVHDSIRLDAHSVSALERARPRLLEQIDQIVNSNSAYRTTSAAL
jgi:hypothetical protein